MAYRIDNSKLGKYRDTNPLFKWPEIERVLEKLTRSDSKMDSNTLMRQIKNEWFVTSNIIICFYFSELPSSCVDNWRSGEGWTKLGKLNEQSRILRVSLSKLFKAANGLKNRVIQELGNAKGWAPEGFTERGIEDTIKGHLKRYLNQISKRKSDLLKSGILKFQLQPNVGCYKQVCNPEHSTHPTMQQTQAIPPFSALDAPNRPQLLDEMQPPTANAGWDQQPSYLYQPQLFDQNDEPGEWDYILGPVDNFWSISPNN